MRRVTNWIRVPAAVVCAGLVAGMAGVRVNTTPSLPEGLYLTSALDGVPRRGMIVEACLVPTVSAFAQARGYVGHGSCEDGSMPLLKPVVAVPGDVVEVAADGVQVNGVVVVPPAVINDGAGRPLRPIPPGTYRVGRGEVWLLSDYNRYSFDSRYFGAVPVAQLRGKAKPLLTW